ncbi:MAG: hypothetical protein J6X02_02725 [Bacilli bacterium]|nr:hypothetical protein [Bacilli bacterium]
MYYKLFSKEELEGYINEYIKRLSGGENVVNLFNELVHEYRIYIGPISAANDRLFKGVQGLAYAYIQVGDKELSGIEQVDHYINEINEMKKDTK